MPHDFMPGLAGVPAAKSAISDVDGQRGVLEYRGIRVEELCLRSSYLETAYLLLFGHLPTHSQFARWNEDIVHHRRTQVTSLRLEPCQQRARIPLDLMQEPRNLPHSGKAHQQHEHEAVERRSQYDADQAERVGPERAV